MIVGTENTFEINLDNAGNVALDIRITSPTGANGKIDAKIMLQILLIYSVHSSIES